MININDFERYLRIERGLKDLTIKNYMGDTERFVEWLGKKPIDADIDDLNRYKEHLLDKKFSKRTINRVVSSLKRLYGFLEEKGAIKENPADKLEPFRVQYQKIPKVLDEEEVLRIIQDIPLDSPENIRDRTIVSMLYSTGLRRAELCGLRIDDIKDNEIHVREEIAKRSKERYIPLVESVRDLLVLYIYQARPKLADGEALDWLFFTPNLEQMYNSFLNRLLDNISKKTNSTQKLTPHKLRHSIATHLLEHDVELTDIQRMLGHSNLATTEIYLHAKKEHFVQQIQSKHPLQVNLVGKKKK